MDIIKLKEAIENSDYDYKDSEWIEYLFAELEDNGLIRISLDTVSSQNGECFTIASYYSDKLHNSIILDWDYRPLFESVEDVIGSISAIEQYIDMIETKLKGL